MGSRWPEIVLFGEDMMKYFMKLNGVEWKSGISGEIWNGHARRFTDEIGYVAYFLATMHPQSPHEMTYVIHINKPTFFNGYNPKDFLHYCGLIGYTSVLSYVKGEGGYFADGASLAIIEYLRSVEVDGQFDNFGGWDGIAAFVQTTMQEIKMGTFGLQQQNSATGGGASTGGGSATGGGPPTSGL